MAVPGLLAIDYDRGLLDPFRAFLGAILSADKGGVVEASVFDDGQILHTIDEAEERRRPSNSDGDDASGEYNGRSGQGPVGRRPFIRSRARNDSRNDSNGAALSVRPSCASFFLKGPSEFISIDFVIFPTVS